jgi:CBS domain-containing protein/sporulation protein YlmC with PRC-barrel domain
MTSRTTFYLSQILGKKFFSHDGHVTGKVMDFLIDLTPIAPSPEKPTRPKVIAVKVKVGMYERVFDFSSLEFIREKASTRIICHEIEEISTAYLSNVLWLRESILKKQIVDITGKKLEKVTDVRLVVIPSGTYAIAVDVGIEGILRHLGLVQIVEAFEHRFNVSILPSRLILWDDIEAVDLATSKLWLSKATTKLTALHPSDLADIIEELDKHTRTYVFASLDEEQAADVLEEMEPDAQVQIIESLPVGKAADVLEKMPADEVADILDELEDKKKEELLKEMEQESSEEVRELLEYEDKEVGSIMNTDIYTLSPGITVAAALEELRKAKPEPIHISTLFVIDKNERLLASVPLAELVIADPAKKISQIMRKDPVTVKDTDRLATLAELVSKYNLLALPVLSEDDKLEGMVLVEDIVDDLLDRRKTK